MTNDGVKRRHTKAVRSAGQLVGHSFFQSRPNPPWLTPTVENRTYANLIRYNQNFTFLSRRIFFASAHGTKVSSPELSAASRSRNTSPCHSGDGYSSSALLRSCQSSSIARSFSVRVILPMSKIVFMPSCSTGFVLPLAFDGYQDLEALCCASRAPLTPPMPPSLPRHHFKTGRSLFPWALIVNPQKLKMETKVPLAEPLAST